MQPATTEALANNVIVMMTNGDTHSPAKWAEMTVGRIMALDGELSPDRARIANELRQGIKDILGDVFDKTRQEACRFDMVNVQTIAHSLSYKIGRAAQGTPWQLHFTHPETKHLIWLELLRALNTIIHDERATRRSH